MENGSLDYWLHEKADGPSQLDWPTRLKIAQGASCGLAYMHQICEPHIVHRDIKSSNYPKKLTYILQSLRSKFTLYLGPQIFVTFVINSSKKKLFY